MTTELRSSRSHLVRGAEQARRRRAWAISFLGVLAVLALGVWLGSAITPRLVSSAPPPPIEDEGHAKLEKLDSALTQSWQTNLQLAARIRSLQAMVGEASEGGRSQIVEGVISTLSDQDLQSIIASAVHLSPDEIDEVRDLRGFSERLAEIAMEDTLQPTNDGAGTAYVVFTSSRPMGDVDSIARQQFNSDEHRIYAVFQTESFERNTVMIKWYRRDQPKILLFQRYSIVPGEPHGFVWHRPSGGWEQGQYEVSIYSGDEAMTPLASGNYTVQ